jgi:hypothetical protein
VSAERDRVRLRREGEALDHVGSSPRDKARGAVKLSQTRTPRAPDAARELSANVTHTARHRCASPGEGGFARLARIARLCAVRDRSRRVLSRRRSRVRVPSLPFEECAGNRPIWGLPR